MTEYKEYKDVINNWFNTNDQLKAIRFKQLLDYLTEMDNSYGIRGIIEGKNNQLLTTIKELSLRNDETRKKINELELLVQNHSDLLNEENALNDRNNNLIEIQNKIENLKSKKLEIEKPENEINDLNDRIKELNGAIERKLNDYIVILQSLSDELVKSSGEIEKETNDKISVAIANINAVSKKQYSLIEKLSNEPVKTIYETFDEKISTLITEYNDYVQKIESTKSYLEEIENKHITIVESFKIHGLENERIFGNVKDKDGINTYVETLICKINQKLEEFDIHIKSLIEKRKELPLFERIKVTQ